MAVAPASATTAYRHNHTSLEEIRSCPVYRMLPEPLRQASERQPHVWQYLHSLPIEKTGVPLFTPTLSRKHKDLKNPNLVYPVGEATFVHICPDPEDSRDNYNVVEPGYGEDLDTLLNAVEERLVDLVDESAEHMDAAARVRFLLKAVDKLCTVDDSGRPAVRLKNGRLRVSSAQLMGLKYRIVRDKEGMGALAPLLEDPYIEDVSCSGIGPLFVEHKIFGALKASVVFEEEVALDRFVIAMSEKIGRPVTFRQPVVDATLLDGSRINMVFGSDLSRRGSNFTIRKFAATPLSVLELIETGSLNYQVAAYLSLALAEGMNIFVSGETASGKTTLLNAVTTFIPPANKIVSIEDTPELQVPHPNWAREVVRGMSNSDGGGGAVTMFDLLKAALRQRPNEIIIGEIRGEEGAIAFQAMQTGHACMATFHASSVEKLIQRLTGHPINVPKTYVDNLNIAVIQSAVRLKNGKAARRILSINEIIGYDSSTDSFSYVEVFRWDPSEDTFEFTGFMNSYLLEYKMAPKRGIAPGNKKAIYQELDRRAAVLKAIHSKGVTNFYDLYRLLSKAYREGLLR